MSKVINRREFLFLGLLAIMVLLFGIWPAPLLDVMHPTIENLAAHVMQSKL